MLIFGKYINCRGICVKLTFNKTDLKYFLFIILFVYLILPLSAQDIVNSDPEHFCSKKMINKYKASFSKDIIQSPLLHDYDVKFYHLDLEVENNTVYISGNVLLNAQVEANELDTFAFELLNELTVEKVMINEIDCDFTHINDEVFVQPNQPLNEGEEFSAQIFYHGLPPTGGFFSGISTEYDSNWEKSVTWTLSEPFNARQWWPTKQVLTDKADSVWVSLTTSAENKAGSIGLLHSVVPLPDNKVRYEWRSKYPIAYYLISFAVAEYMEYNIYAKPDYLQGDSILIQNYIYDSPGSLEYYKPGMDFTLNFMELFIDLFEFYPFDEEKYGHCLAELSGGMEHQTMTTIGGFSFSLTAHELGHMWFGNNVTCENWSDIWINEGFATYTDYLATDMIAGGPYPMIWKTNTHNYIMSEPGGSVYVPPEEVRYDNVGRIFDSRLTYWKGAVILHMIRFELQDDDLFFNVLNNFQEQFADGTASTQDFINVLNETSDKDFTTFFDQWYYGEGYPIYSFEWNQHNGIFVLSSLQSASLPAVTPFFEMHFPVRLYLNDGPDSTLIFHQTLPNMIFSATLETKIDSINVDPELWILKKIERQLSIISTPINIYPNPTRDLINIISNNTSKYKVIIKDLQGKSIINFEFSQPNATIDLSTFAAGIYLINLESEDSSTVTKIVKY